MTTTRRALVRKPPVQVMRRTPVVLRPRPGRGFPGFMFRLMGFTGQEPKVPPFFKLRAVTDKKALKADLLQLAQTSGLVRLVPSHGGIVTNDPAGALRRAAEKAL